ncbi:Transcription factor SRM1 [Glycine soja]
MFEETHQENDNAIEFLDEHTFYYDKKDEQWFKEKDEILPLVILPLSLRFLLLLLQLIRLLSLKILPVSLPKFLLPPPMRFLLPPLRVQVPSPRRVLGSVALAPQRVYTFADLVLVSSASITWVRASQRVLASQVHVLIGYQHHLLSQNTKSNHVMLSGDSSRSIHHNKYTHLTKEEHRSFLLRPEKYKQGGWKNISKKFFPTKTPTQVACNAQKYFKRKNVPHKERKRKSIHDITLEDIDMIVTSHIDQYNWVPPPPNFAMQPHKIQQAQHMQQQFNLCNLFRQMGGYRNFNYGHQHNELDLAMQQFLHNMPHQMGGYGYSSNWSHDIEHKN